MKYNFIPILFMLCFIFSCSERTQEVKQEYTHEIILDIKNAKDISELKKITESEYLILETPNETDYIGTFDKVIQKGDKIVILDETKQTIWVYNLDGTLYSKINRSGEGPEEYRNIRDIHYDEEKESIYIWDGGWLLYLYEYSLTGELKSKTFFDVYADNFYIVDSVVLFSSTSNNFLNKKENNYYIHKFSIDGCYIDSYTPIPSELINMSTEEKNIFTGHTYINHIPDFTDKVISFDNNFNIKKYIKFQYQDKSINKSPIRINNPNHQSNSTLINYANEICSYGNYIKKIEVLYDIKDFIAINFLHKKGAYTTIYNKTTKEASTYIHKPYYDMSMKPFSYTEDAFISIDDPSILEDVDPESIINYKNIKEEGFGSVINQVVIYNRIKMK